MKYHDKLLRVTAIIEENYDDPAELITLLGLSVEDIMKLLPDVLVANYNKFMVDYDDIEEDPSEEDEEDDGIGEGWEEEEEDSY